jgi:hypothetical protein
MTNPRAPLAPLSLLDPCAEPDPSDLSITIGIALSLLASNLEEQKFRKCKKEKK